MIPKITTLKTTEYDKSIDTQVYDSDNLLCIRALFKKNLLKLENNFHCKIVDYF